MLPAMCDKDKEDIKWGVANDIDYIAASFVRKPSDVMEIRAYLKQLYAQQSSSPDSSSNNGLTAFGGARIKIISKIESTEALKNFDSILAVSDAIMVRMCICCMYICSIYRMLHVICYLTLFYNTYTHKLTHSLYTHPLTHYKLIHSLTIHSLTV